ncbi:MAG: hypothetical protein H7Y88_06270 [Phycisphaerales bacterium]|nr:hypothetical protein [Phycisphaerales bacterium]
MLITQPHTASGVAPITEVRSSLASNTASTSVSYDSLVSVWGHAYRRTAVEALNPAASQSSLKGEVRLLGWMLNPQQLRDQELEVPEHCDMRRALTHIRTTRSPWVLSGVGVGTDRDVSLEYRDGTFLKVIIFEAGRAATFMVFEQGRLLAEGIEPEPRDTEFEAMIGQSATSAAATVIAPDVIFAASDPRNEPFSDVATAA